VSFDKRTWVEAASLARDSSGRTRCRKKWVTTTLDASYSDRAWGGKRGVPAWGAPRDTEERGGGDWRSGVWWSSGGPSTGKGAGVVKAAAGRRIEDTRGGGWSGSGMVRGSSAMGPAE
jgi:hypothetical protein